MMIEPARILRGRRSIALLVGGLLCILILFSDRWRPGSGSSPFQFGINRSSSAEVTAVDGLKDFKKTPECSFSSLELHHPYTPRCTDRKSLLSAMSGGGRLGWDAPYWTRDCDMQWFTPDEICGIMSRFDHIYLVGDTMLRHLAQALNVLIRRDLVNGGRATWRDQGADKDPLNCRCQNVFTNPGCVWWAAVNTADVLHGDPKSVHCGDQPALVSWNPILNYPIKEDPLHAIFEGVESKHEPNGRDIFIFGHGLWNDLEVETTMSWTEQIEDAMEEEMPAYFQPRLDQKLFPRLFITPAAQGEAKTEVPKESASETRGVRHTHEIADFVKKRGYEHLGLYNLTVQASSADGTHATLENNVMKAMMVLNWLNQLEPTPRENPPKLPPQSTSNGAITENKDLPKEQDVVQAEKAKEESQSSSVSKTTSTSASISQSSSATSSSSKSTTAAAATVLSTKTRSAATYNPTKHPIDHLVDEADKTYEGFMKQQTSGVSKAADAYRKRRKRHPPPKFDEWVKWCEERKVLVIEEFFDQIYDDLNPFWAVSPKLMREFPKSWMNVLSIRDGKMSRWEDEPANIANWMDFWYTGFSMLPLQDLPDIDLAFNGEDEPKMFVPWETINDAKVKAELERTRTPPSKLANPRNSFAKRDPLPARRPPPNERTGFEWADFPEDKRLWEAARETCEPHSAARNAPADEDYSRAPVFPDAANLTYMHEGYVANWSAAKSSCENPGLRSLHGTWIGMLSSAPDNPKPRQKALINQLVPMLSGCKIHDVNAEILIPPAMQWPSKADDTDFTFNFKESARVQWENKIDQVMWRGSASGGVNDEDNWTRFQRHRFLAMLNGTLVSEHQRVVDKPRPAHVPGGKPALPHNFPLPDPDIYPLAFFNDTDPVVGLEHWIDNHTDAGFIHLRCWPPPSWFTGNGQDCPYNGMYYTVKTIVPSTEAYRYKYQPDLDGASYSGRYRALLQSYSLPIKATIYDEWHDSRLIPWRHFVPIDNTFVDWWGVMEYFLGYESHNPTLDSSTVNSTESDPAKAHEGHGDTGAVLRPGHDDVAKRIGMQGSEWTRTVLRTDDMLAYVYRLILELARLSDDEREGMGYAEDTKGTH